MKSMDWPQFSKSNGISMFFPFAMRGNQSMPKVQDFQPKPHSHRGWGGAGKRKTGETVMPVILVIFPFLIHQIFSLMCDWSKRIMWLNIPQPKLGNIWEYSPIFKTARIAKYIWRIINTVASIWSENMLGYLPLNIICSSRLTVLIELRSRKTVSDNVRGQIS